MNKNKKRYFAVKDGKIWSCMTDVKNMEQAIEEADAYDCSVIVINEESADFIQSQF